MDITPAVADDRFLIRGYGKGYFRINDARYEGAILITPGALLLLEDGETNGSIPDPSLLSEDAQQLIDANSILLCGAGNTFPSHAADIIASYVHRYKRAPDIMDTGAACRTFNVLAGEDRDVCALLLPVS